MKYNAILLAILLATGGAYAGTDKSTGEVCQGSTCNSGGSGEPGGTGGQGGQGGAGGEGGAGGSSVADSSSYAFSGATSSANSGSSTVTYYEAEGIHYSGGYELENVPSMALGGIDPTVPCAVPIEGTYSGVGIGVGLGTAYIDENCEMREIIRLGLSGDRSSKNLANRLLRKELRSYLNGGEPKEEKVVQDVAVGNEGGYWYTTYEGM